MAEIEVREHGSPSDPTVVVLHGGPGAPGSVAGLARALASRFHVLEPLQRRSGGEPLTVARHVEDLAGVLAEDAALVGWSWGAMLGLSFAAAYPQGLRSLALVGCGTYDEASRLEYKQRMRMRMQACAGESGRRLELELSQASEGAQRDALLARLAQVAERAQSFEFAAEFGQGDALPSGDSSVDARSNSETWSDVLRLQAHGLEPARFAAIEAPVLMLHGDDDPHPGRRTFEQLRRHIPDLGFVGFERCGHAPWQERYARAAFLERLERWLRDPQV